MSAIQCWRPWARIFSPSPSIESTYESAMCGVWHVSGRSGQPSSARERLRVRARPGSYTRGSRGRKEPHDRRDHRARHHTRPSRLAQRVIDVPPSGIRKFFDVLATMPDVISLGVGEPDFTTPPQIIEEGVRSLRSGRTHYTSNYGTIELRRALSRNLDRLYGVGYDPDGEILVTVGASEALAIALAAIIDPGDEVILHEPSYVAYIPGITFAGGVPVLVPTSQEDGWALDPAKLEAAITPRTKALFLGYPCNPTGAVLEPAQLRAIADIAPAPRPHRHQRRDLRPAGLRRPPARGVQRAAGHAGADHPAGRLLQGVCHDRLAGGLCLRAKGPHGGAGQDPPVPDHVRAHHGPGRGARGAHGRGAGCASAWSASTTGAAGCSWMA